MKFNKLEVVDRPVELTQEEWEEARRATLREMVDVFGEAAVERFVRGVGDAPPPFIMVKPPAAGEAQDGAS